MANALSDIGGPPPAPDPNAQALQQAPNALQAQQVQQMPQGAPGTQAPQGQAQQPPPPSHQQTVAALRHFQAIERELSGLLKDPQLGKADMKSQFIDGATKLVAQGIMSPAEAVSQLGTVPERPFDQKKWVEQHFATTLQAMNSILQHHVAGFAGMPMSDDHGSPDNHSDVIAGLTKQYGAGN